MFSHGQIVTHDINHLLQYPHGVDQVREGDDLDLAEQMQRIEGDELDGLFHFVRSQEDEPVMRTPSPIYVEVPVPYPVHSPPAPDWRRCSDKYSYSWRKVIITP